MTVPEWPTLGVPLITSGILDLLECAESAVEAIGAGPVCHSFVYPGEERVPYMHCGECTASGDCGSVWVRLVTAYPYLSFPFANEAGTCASPLAYQIELGVHRCFQVMDDDGEPSGDETITTKSLELIEDQRALWTAVQCCESAPLRGAVIGPWTPLGPEGNCVGGMWLVSLDPWGGR